MNLRNITLAHGTVTTCDLYVSHMYVTCLSLQRVFHNVHHVCDYHMPIYHMSITCRSHVSHMSLTCLSHVSHMQVTWYHYPRYRLWRKNVSPIDGTECAGVDLNRNFNSHWHEYVRGGIYRQTDSKTDRQTDGETETDKQTCVVIMHEVEDWGRETNIQTDRENIHCTVPFRHVVWKFMVCASH